MIRTILKYSFLAAIVVYIYTSSVTQIAIVPGNEDYFLLGYFGIVIMPIFTFLALKAIRNTQYSGKMSFKNALVAGLSLSIISALAYQGLKGIEKLIVGDYYQTYLIEQTKIELANSGKTNQIEARVNKIQEHYSSWKPLRNTLIWYTGLGLVYTIASYFILNRKK